MLALYFYGPVCLHGPELGTDLPFSAVFDFSFFVIFSRDSVWHIKPAARHHFSTC